MKIHRSAQLRLIAAIGLVLTTLSPGVLLAEDSRLTTYRVTIQNLTHGQPLSPPVAATHGSGLRMFVAGQLASSELEAIAEDGDQIPMFDLLSASGLATGVVDVGMPLTPYGTTVGDFTDSVTFDIQAYPGDRLSLATMLICTNDGFTGLDGARLPHHGTVRYGLRAFDAGTEDNTEASPDIVDPCTDLGPVALAGDPNGNVDDAVDTSPHQPIAPHPNIRGGADLSRAEHGWRGPIAVVTISRVDGP